MGRLFNCFAVLVILIACLGLFGLASYTVESRTKEIGIRRVLGASIPTIAGILCKEFIVLIVLANIVAWPVSCYFLRGWLESFAYRIDMGILIFASSGLTAIFIALLTVSFQSIKAATSNPVDSLRYE